MEGIWTRAVDIRPRILDRADDAETAQTPSDTVDLPRLTPIQAGNEASFPCVSRETPGTHGLRGAGIQK